jgi:2-C-methyl-D-erythritol 4-phosphate cytidylyltransferase
MRIEALIQAAGGGTRLGLGPKAFVMLAGRTLLEHAIEVVRGAVDNIVVAVPADGIERTRAIVGSEAKIIAGGATRNETTRLLVSAASAPLLLLHDVVHPFATAPLVRALLAAAEAHGAAAPAIANTEFAYDREGRPLHAPGDLLVGQKPVAFARREVIAAYGQLADAAAGADPSLIDVLDRAGLRARFIPGSARNIKITGPDDLALAEAMIAATKPRYAAS